MSLFDVQKGKKRQPFNVILFGQPGLGKSTWASEAPNSLFIGGEETGELDVARFPKTTSYQDFFKQVEHITTHNNELGFQTLVIDTIDSVEAMLHQKILKEDPKQIGSMIAAHGGYGKAYEMAASELLKLRALFERIRDSGVNLIFLAHSKKVQAIDPIMGLSYDTYELNLHQRAQAVFVDWVSAVLFANYVLHPQAGTNTDRVFATGDGERVLLTEKRPGHLGKNRFSLPYEMPLKFSEFYSRWESFYSDGPKSDDLIASVKAMIDLVQDEKVKKKANELLTKAGVDVIQLSKIQTRLQEILKQ